MAVENINKERLSELISEGNPLLVDYYAPWCIDCKRIAPALDKMCEEYKDKLLIVKINVDDYPELREFAGARRIPTLVTYRDGKDQGQISEPRSKAIVEQLIEKTLGIKKEVN